MGTTPSKRPGNNFDLLRLSAALLVAFGHAMDVFLGSERFSPVMKFQSFGGLGLNTFCVISGYLITQSRLRNSVRDFAISRVLRIFPALVVAVLVLAFVLGPLETKLPLGAYFGAAQTWRFLGSAFILPLNDSLPGVFNNGALIGQIYSITPEVLFYCFAGLLGGWRYFSYAVGIVLLGIACFLIVSDYTVMSFAGVFIERVGGMILMVFPFRLGTLCLFNILMGSAIAIAKPNGPMLYRLVPVFLVLLIAGMFQTDHRAYDMIEMLCFPLLVIAVGMNETWRIRIPTWIGDVSYGTYLYHFVVAQVLFSAGPAKQKTWLGIICSVLVSALVGWVSFQLVEKRALTWKPRRTALAVRDVSVAERAAEAVMTAQ